MHCWRFFCFWQVILVFNNKFLKDISQLPNRIGKVTGSGWLLREYGPKVNAAGKKGLLAINCKY